MNAVCHDQLLLGLARKKGKGFSAETPSHFFCDFATLREISGQNESHAEPQSRKGYSSFAENEDGKSFSISLWPCCKVVLYALVAGLLILTHGCHGDEDNELFTSTLFTLSAPAE